MILFDNCLRKLIVYPQCAVTNALRETLLSFGGSVATELTELLEAHRIEAPANAPEPAIENNQNVANKHVEPKNMANMSLDRTARKEPDCATPPHPALRTPLAPPAPAGPPAPLAPPPVQNGPLAPPPAVKNARVLGAAMPPANRPPPGPPRPTPGPAARPSSNVSFVLQPVLGGYGPAPLYGPPRVAGPAPPVFPNAYYEYPGGGWHFAYESYERPPGNVNLNFNLPPKNLVVNGRGPCRPDEAAYAPQAPAQGCWIKPTIFYDGFWTEQKVKKWVAEQVEKQFPEDASTASSVSPDKA